MAGAGRRVSAEGSNKGQVQKKNIQKKNAVCCMKMIREGLKNHFLGRDSSPVLRVVKRDTNTAS